MKIAGCILIFLAATGAGLYASMELERRKKQLAGLRRGIVSLMREIEFQLSPLCEAFLHTGERSEQPWNLFFKNVGQKLEICNVAGEYTDYEYTNMEQNNLFYSEKNYPMNISEIFEWEIKKIEKFHPWKKDLEILKTLSKGLGQLDKEMQVAQLKLAEEEIMQAEKEALEEQKKKGQLYKSLGFCMGILGVIILL